MPSITKKASTVANVATTGTQAWVNAANLQEGGSGYAYADGTGSQTKTTQELTASNFQFGLPANAVVQGVSVRINRNKTQLANASEVHVYLKKSGSSVDKATGTAIPYTPEDLTLGGASDLWFATLFPSEVNDNTNFQVVYQASVTSASSPVNEVQVRTLEVTVTYIIGLSIDNTVGLAINPQDATVALIQGTLTTVAGRSIIAMHGQVSTSSGFGTTEADTGDVVTDQGSGASVTVLVSWTPTVAGTYYARLGVQDTNGELVYSDAVSFVVSFPTNVTLTWSHTDSLYTFRVEMDDSYSKPPIVSIDIAGRQFSLPVLSRVTNHYVYESSLELEQGTFQVGATVKNVWQNLSLAPQSISVVWPVVTPHYEVMIGNTPIAVKDLSIEDPAFPSMTRITFQSAVDVGDIPLVVKAYTDKLRVYRVMATDTQFAGGLYTHTCVSTAQANMDKPVDVEVEMVDSDNFAERYLAFADTPSALDVPLTLMEFHELLSSMLGKVASINGVLMYERNGLWRAIDADSTGKVARLSIHQQDAGVTMGRSKSQLVNDIREYYNLQQYPVPASSMSNYDAANWTGTVSNVLETHSHQAPPSGALYCLKGTGEIKRTVAFSKDDYDFFAGAWCPESNSQSLTVRLYSGPTAYWQYVRGFAGNQISVESIYGTERTSEITKTVAFSPAKHVTQLLVKTSAACRVKVDLYVGAVLASEGMYLPTNDNKVTFYWPPDRYQAIAATSMVVTFTDLSSIGGRYGIQLEGLTCTEWIYAFVCDKEITKVTWKHSYNKNGINAGTVHVGSDTLKQGTVSCGSVPNGATVINTEFAAWVENSSETWWISGNAAIGASAYVANGELWILYSVVGTLYNGQDDAMFPDGTGTLKWGYLVECQVATTEYIGHYSDTFPVSELGTLANGWDSFSVPMSAFTAVSNPTSTIITWSVNVGSGSYYLDSPNVKAAKARWEYVDVQDQASVQKYGKHHQERKTDGFNTKASAQTYAEGLLRLYAYPLESYQWQTSLLTPVELGDWVQTPSGDLLMVQSVTYGQSSKGVTVGTPSDSLIDHLNRNAAAIEAVQRVL